MSDNSSNRERWLLDHQGRRLTVEISDRGLRRHLVWLVDGDEVATTTTSDSRVVLAAADQGAVGVRLPELIGPARRVTLFPEPTPGEDGTLSAEAAAHAGLHGAGGGLDFDPEPGSKAAAREAWIRAHPRQFALRRGLAAVAGVVVPILLLWLIGRFALPAIPWPNWSILWPDWSIPWPDWSIPWPDWSIPWPDWSLPGWVQTIMDQAKYVAPVVIALALARGEVKRRRDQDQRKQGAGGAAAEEAPVAQSAKPASTSAAAVSPAATSAKEVDSGESPTRRPPGSR